MMEKSILFTSFFLNKNSYDYIIAQNNQKVKVNRGGLGVVLPILDKGKLVAGNTNNRIVYGTLTG